MVQFMHKQATRVGSNSSSRKHFRKNLSSAYSLNVLLALFIYLYEQEFKDTVRD